MSNKDPPPPPAPPSGPFTVYSSVAKQGGTGSVKTLTAKTNIDNFVRQLSSSSLVFPRAPTSPSPETIPLDPSDITFKWLTLLDPKGTVSAGFHDAATQDIDNFQVRMAAPWDLVFSSAPTFLVTTFGSEGNPGLAPVSKVPVPGLKDTGSLLYMGLDPTTTPVTSSVKELFAFAGLKSPPLSEFAPWGVTLRVSSDPAKPIRNALWYSPLNYDQTIFRLQFSLSDADRATLQSYIAKALPSLEFRNVDFICRRTITGMTTGGKISASAQGEVLIETECHLLPKGHDLQIRARISIFHDQYHLTFQLDEQIKGHSALGDILARLAECVGLQSDDFNFVTDMLMQQDGKAFGDALELRQIQIALGTDDGGKTTKLMSFSVDIQATATFGHENGPDGNPKDADPVVFLLTYLWERGGPTFGSIRGSLWNGKRPIFLPIFLFPSTSTIALTGTWRLGSRKSTLVPTLAKVRKAISIPGLIPGLNIENVPHNIPTDISRAYIVLNQSSIAVGGTVQSLDFTSQDKDYPVPQLNLGWVSIDASYNWTKGATSPLNVKASFLAELRPSKNATHKEPATLVGAMVYDSGKWTLSADLEGLYLSSLYNFFFQMPSNADPDATGEADHVLPLIEAIEIESMKLTYVYDKTPTTGDQVVGSSFTFDGILNVSDLQLKLHFSYEKKASEFRATLHAGSATTIGKIIEDLVGDCIDVPEFLYDAKLDPAKDGLEIGVMKGSSAKPGTPAPFHFVAKLTVNFPKDVQITLTFAQWHGSNWSASEPSKKPIKAALTGIPHVSIPLVGDITQPFDEMYFMHVIDGTKKKSSQQLPGISRKEKDDLNLDEAFKAHPLVVKDKSKDTSDDVVVITAGAHLAIVIKNERGERVCILDYNFKKQKTVGDGKENTKKRTIPAGGESKEPAKKDSDGSAASAPLKKKMGGLSISDIGLKYENKILSISFTATMELGPVGFSLIGFALNMELTSLNLSDIRMLPPSLEGFSVVFERKPLSIAGIIRHGKTPELEYYAGGLIVGWTPYQLEAAGFYGKAKPEGRDPFVSVFVFAKLAGPLVSLEFAEISGVTGGFGYNSSVRVPTADQIPSFPFIDQHSTDNAGDALEALQKLTSAGQDAWFQPLPDTYWAAAGMKIDAFQTIALDAVVVVQFGTSIKLGIFGVALVDVPSSLSDFKFAHVELGLAVVANVGNFVFSLGGYHQAFKVPVGWPVPDRLKISWGLGNNLSISGEAFFAITPKVCMGGGRLRASYSAGPIAAWFDAFANFLIQYQPFHFASEAGICIGASFNLDIWFIHIHISVEVSADLYLWGPPLAGIVSVNIKVARFNIHFGDDNNGPGALQLDQFFDLVLQASSKKKAATTTTPMLVAIPIIPIMEPDQAARFKRMSDNVGHTFLARFGLMNDTSDPKREQNAEWVVRGGTFSFSIGCKMMVDDVKLVGNSKEDINSKASGAGSIYAKPMKTDSSLASHMTVRITQTQGKQVWGMRREYKSVPTGLWQKYDSSKDPLNGKANNNIDDYLNDKDGGMKLMSGILLSAPPPKMSDDKLKVFDIIDSTLMEIESDRQFPLPTDCHKDWDPHPPRNEEDDDEWTVVQKRWKTPLWNTDNEPKHSAVSLAVDSSPEAAAQPIVPMEPKTRDVQTDFVSAFVHAFNWDAGLKLPSLAKMPRKLEKRFGDLFVVPPMMTA
ncbi:uncharacterized protein QC763_511180 [Podospora pseudopauciseta]|uniref:DUF6603 domain-containing protein n=1 Tax=Podospora pseudopauciseta TaxID=2093780 RepID=A0ABR0HB74_9PEZI|nr:hypothetical protein QC763_511180 [Podospora pseudopauciseta]